MPLEAVSPAHISTGQAAVAQAQFGIQVLRRTLDIEAEQGLQMVRMMATQTGVGQAIDTQA